ncbi:MAG: helix-turn-helix domain-containing protein [Opitutaceae bacterium]|nr:helix-turn-helix domain-containing protein [Opitutaceae bacterium]
MSTSRVRREGFAGQHMTALPDPVRQAVLSHPLLRGLLVTDAGYFPRAAGHRVERPQGSVTHLLVACLHGEGWVRGAGRAQPVAAGDLVWLSAGQPHSYGAGAHTPWTIVWAHFRGEEVAAWQEQLGWAAKRPLGTIRIDPARLPELKFDTVYDALEHGYAIPQLLAASAALRTTLCAALTLTQRCGANRSAAERTALIRTQLSSTPARSYRLAELATAAGLSVPHFSLLFRLQTGYAPIDFLIRQRIRHACRLLDTTATRIGPIAAEVGFEDPYYFSRCFRRVMGCSPAQYRKTIKA